MKIAGMLRLRATRARSLTECNYSGGRFASVLEPRPHVREFPFGARDRRAPDDAAVFANPRARQQRRAEPRPQDQHDYIVGLLQACSRSKGPLSDHLADARNSRGQCRGWVDLELFACGPASVRNWRSADLERIPASS